jgi:uncharacterized protein (UPF0332 family)/predicted nucleotidyltransferase
VSRTESIEYFSREVQRALGPSLAKLILYGSTATGEAQPGSDIDIAAIHFGSGREVLDRAAEIGFETALRYGEIIECIPISVHEYRHGGDRSFFLREVRRGRILFEMDEKGAIRQEASEYLALAEEYRSFAKGALERGEYRAAVDLGYNAAEVLVKALILLRGESLAQTHGGIVQQFGRLYVVGGRLDKRLGSDLHKALLLRGKARYDPKALLAREDAETILVLIETLVNHLSRDLASPSG